MGTVILSDNALAKVVTVWPWHYSELALYFCKVNANSDRLFVLLEPHSSTDSVPVLTMTTFLEITLHGIV